MDSHHESAQAGWIASASPVVLAGQNRAIDVQAAYLGARLGTPANVDRKAVLAAAKVDLSEPFIALAKSLSNGDSLEEALLAGALRAEGLGETAAYWAARSANSGIDDVRIVGWTRTLGGNSCEWCIQVSGQTYRTADTASFGHARCNCGVDPIIGDRNPGRTINDELTAV